VPIITSTMLRVDPLTFVVTTQPPVLLAPAKPRPVTEPAGRVLAALAVAGLVTRACELVAAARR
jgi:hypothetical protein